uniref:CCHC-type domain-containing protein n=1 Tax=Tanacetum cinerariifolium TaxID=118510 RepID=A0A6L2LXL1_TANCI|nr:hypothetical protein [Tanacetum cinerariifolium]
MESKKKIIVVTSDQLALIDEKTNVSRTKEKVIVSADSEGSEANDLSELKKITALLAKAYNCKKEGHFAKDCKKVKVKDYEYYKTKMLLTKKDKDEQVKENQEKDKIGSKPDKNGKRGEAEKSLKQLQWVKEEKLSKTQKEWPKTQTQSKAIQTLKE